MTQRFKRRNFFIKKQFQGKFLLGHFLFISGGGLLFMVLLSVFSADTLSLSYASQGFHPGQPPLAAIRNIIAANWVLITIGGVLLAIASLLLSHKIAGPLYRFEKVLGNMAEGHLDDTIKLRPKDEGQELAEKINLLNANLTSSLRAINNNSEALDVLLEQISALDLPNNEKETLASLCWSMRERNRKIKAICSYYTFKRD